MFERFTVAARDVVKGAVEVAGEVRAPQVDTGHLLVALARDTGPTGGALRDRHIGSEHVLLGVLADPAFLAVRLLARYETDVPALRRSVLDGRDRRAG